MKKIFFLVMFSLIQCFTFSQHLIILKSGEQFQGKLIEFKKGQLKFSFKNNLMSFNEKEVASIVFDSLSLINEINQKENSTMKGVVTYYFNRNYGYKPDVGAKVYIIADKDLGNIDTLSINNFIRAQLLRTTISLSDEKGKRQWLNELAEINAETEEKFKNLDEKCHTAVMSIQNNAKTIELSVDGNGSFSKLLKPNDYTVLIISNNRKSISLTELMGKIYITKIKLLNNNEEVVNTEFNQF